MAGTTTPLSVPDIASPQLIRRQASDRHKGFWFICLTLAIIGLFTVNGIITSAAIMVLPLLGFLLWREGEPPVLLFGCAFQWLQATAAIFYTNNLGQTLDDAFGSHVLTIASWLSIAAVLILAIGVRCAFIGAGSTRKAELEAEASRLDIKKIAVLYVISFAISGVLTTVAWWLPSITQPLLAVASLKWAVVFLLCYTVLHQRTGYGVLVACIGLEFATSLFGVFANFKSVFFVLVVAAMSSPLALRGRRLAATVTCFGVLFVLGVVWSAVKMDYREFLTNVETANEESIPIEQRVTKLADLVQSVTWDNFTDGIDALILRVSYVNLFALTIENVPLRMPYENGELWKNAVTRVLTPRFLFPDKAVTDDSERTRLYTGLNVAGSEAGTSIGIGYVGESYIDFGPFWMFTPIFLLGLLYGVIDRFFITRTRYKLLGSAFALSILIFNAYEIETSNIKLVGGVIAAALVAIVIYKIFGNSIVAYLRQWPTDNMRRRSSSPVGLTVLMRK
jgi:hypothetical protein